jgi:hypothetical protein
MLLEDTFTPQFNTVRRLCNPPPEPPSGPQAPMFGLSGQVRTSQDELLSEGLLINREKGINALCFEAVTFWSEITSYLRDIRSGKVETPWLITSTYQRMAAKAFALESNIGSTHLVRNVNLERSCLIEIEQNQEYWTAWMYMQVTSHAALALLNHPFIHLVALRKNSCSEKPYLFLQQTIDQAIYHSGWVARLLNMCENVGLHIQSPFLGFVAAAVATIAWFFQHAADHRISRAASEDLRSIKKFLDQLSKQWSCIKSKVGLCYAVIGINSEY